MERRKPRPAGIRSCSFPIRGQPNFPNSLIIEQILGHQEIRPWWATGWVVDPSRSAGLPVTAQIRSAISAYLLSGSAPALGAARRLPKLLFILHTSNGFNNLGNLLF